MVRRGWLLPIGASALLAGAPACSDDGGEPAAPTFAPAAPGPQATLPTDVDAGRGALVLGDDLYELTVTCSLETTTDEASGVTTELVVDAGDEVGTVVTITRQSTVGDVPTVTDIVAVDIGGTIVESERFDAGGQLIDLRLPNPLERLIQVTPTDAGTLIEASGVFGPSESLADDPANVEGSLRFRCP